MKKKIVSILVLRIWTKTLTHCFIGKRRDLSSSLLLSSCINLSTPLGRMTYLILLILTSFEHIT